MLLQQTVERLHEMKLTGMAQALEEQGGIPDIADLSFEDRLALLLEREHTARDDRRLRRLLQLARLRSRRYDKARLDAACTRALRSGARSYRSVKSILEHGLDQVGDHQMTLTLPAAHLNVRGAAYYSTHPEGMES